MTQRRTTHKDVEFHVSDEKGAATEVLKRWDEAAAVAVLGGTMGNRMHLDAVVWSEAGARWYGGADAVREYREDPEASVFERLEVIVKHVGRVP